MKKPSIDRKDNDEHYTYDNCQYIEFEENRIKDRCKPILQHDLDGNLRNNHVAQSGKLTKGS